MRRLFSRFLLNLFGWNVVATVPDIPKSIICVAPHTSNWDFILGKLAYMSLGRQAGFLMKKEWFFFPLGYVFRWMGGVPVSRDKKTDLVEQLAEKYRTSDKFAIAVTPEATRKRNANWKRGFYYIAQAADIPIVLAYIDYKDKRIGLEKVFVPTGDIEADMYSIKEYYKQFHARHPENFTTEE